MDYSCSQGPVSTMPGSTYKAQPDIPCEEEGCTLSSDIRVQGETDSIGCEYHHYCSTHYTAFKLAVEAHAQEARTGMCDWCGKHATDLRNRRDYDEGSSGRIYRVCSPCCTKDNERAAEELDELREGDDWRWIDDRE